MLTMCGRKISLMRIRALVGSLIVLNGSSERMDR